MSEYDDKKNLEEIGLIADYEMEWGQHQDTWPESIVQEFDRKWNEIQNKYLDHCEPNYL